MANPITEAIGNTVRKAKKAADDYTQAARDLASMPGTVRKAVAPYKEIGQAFDKADSGRTEAARKRARKAP